MASCKEHVLNNFSLNLTQKTRTPFLCLQEICIEKAPGEKLGISIRGGAKGHAGNPFDPTDEGIFISKVPVPWLYDLVACKYCEGKGDHHKGPLFDVLSLLFSWTAHHPLMETCLCPSIFSPLQQLQNFFFICCLLLFCLVPPLLLLSYDMTHTSYLFPLHSCCSPKSLWPSCPCRHMCSFLFSLKALRTANLSSCAVHCVSFWSLSFVTDCLCAYLHGVTFPQEETPIFFSAIPCV